ncbi:MAG: GNAT family N-acetyltransferase, partial [Deltaproteobacteria bacterium]|nr:GNAT family N-acetyltransferase [Deltaproteobacteria bacterium]
SDPSHEAFFREAADCFREKGRLFFTELSVDGAVVASTSNFISGDAGFAFKIGWRPEFAKLSPGMLNEVECIRNAPERFGNLAFIDSGAEEGSFIDQLWTGRRGLSSGFFGTTPLGKNALSVVDRVRTLKRRLAGAASS